jgi:hypothetical protein
MGIVESIIITTIAATVIKQTTENDPGAISMGNGVTPYHPRQGLYENERPDPVRY